jgi:hypothetical protein
MIWDTIQRNWNELQGRVLGQRSSADERRNCNEYLRRKCDVSPEEACRDKREWMKDPGVLDDWNDTRSILDM